MYPITEAVRALFEAENAKVLRITGSTVKKLPTEISVYNGDELIYQSGDGKHLKLYSGSTEIYDSQDAHVVILYSGTEPIFINDEAGMPIQIEITSDNVRESSFFIDRYSCNGEKLEVGTAIAAEMKLTLDNADGQFDGVVFEGTELFVEVGVADWTQESPAVNWVPCGYFTPDEQPRRLTTITIEALDRMTRFDVAVDATALSFPATIAGLVGQVCTACGVTLAQSISALTNADVTVAELPSSQGQITYRNIIQWCAGIMGTNAWFDWNGQLRFSWYDNATGYVSTTDNRYSSDLFENDLTVTGVEYTNDSGIAIVEGTDDYAIDLTGNTIAGPLIATVLPPLNMALNGFTYRPFTAAVVNAPYLWPMDVVTFTDKNGSNHTSALTNVAFGLNGTTALESKGMTYAINKAAQPKGFTREQAQLINQVAQDIENNIDDSLTQQEIFNRLTDNGAAQGMVLYNGQLYINASYINSGIVKAEYIDGENLHVKAANIDGTLVIGQLPSDVATDSDIPTKVSELTNDSGFQNSSQVTTITNNTISTTNVTAQNLKVKAANVEGTFTANKIVGGTMTLGGANNVNGVLQVLDASGNVVVTINNAGADITDGSVVAYSDDRQRRVLLSDGIVAFQYYNDVAQPLGWRDALKLSIDDALDTQISTYGGGGELDISGRGRVYLSNKADTLDDANAEIDMDDDSIAMRVTSGAGVIEGASLRLAPDSFRMSYRDPLTGDTSDMFEFVPNGASNTPLDIGNGGTGATNATNARAKLGITPANIGAAPEIQVTTVTGTPDSNGNISMGLSAGRYVVVSAKVSSLIATPWVSGSDNNWHARIIGVNGSAITSGSVTVTVYYQAL